MSEDLKTEKQTENFEFVEIADLEAPLRRIIEQLKERLKRGDYGLIIGDDASGRIPAIILGNFIKKISEQNGLNGPETIFIPGGLNKDKAEEFFKKNGRFG